VLQAQANGVWCPVTDYPEKDKKEAISLLKWKKKNHTETKWRVILRTIKDKKIA
jgi:hypothetical protein